jgi:membrane fusion protein (multidrug efflux system)
VLGLCGGCSKPDTAPVAAPPVEVKVTGVVQQDVPVTGEWVASMDGFVNAAIRAQVAGYLLQQDYKEGALVHQGDPLFTIDPAPFQAQLAQAQGLLDQARAQLEKTRLDVERYTPLAKSQAISQEELDNAVQANLAAKAQVETATAAVQQAQLNLGFTKITSPVTGVAGLIQAQIGDLVGPATGVLTTVSTLDPMKVYFPVSEQTYLNFNADDPNAVGFPPDVALELILSDGRTYPQKGKFYAADRQIDPGTGTLRIAALFPNPSGLLRPGLYGRVRAAVRTEKGALLVPQRALTEMQGGSQAVTVDAGNVAHVRNVTTGPKVGSLIVVETGLKPGEQVVVEGLQKVKEGVVVHPGPYTGE